MQKKIKIKKPFLFFLVLNKLVGYTFNIASSWTTLLWLCYWSVLTWCVLILITNTVHRCEEMLYQTHWLLQYVYRKFSYTVSCLTFYLDRCFQSPLTLKLKCSLMKKIHWYYCCPISFVWLLCDRCPKKHVVLTPKSPVYVDWSICSTLLSQCKIYYWTIICHSDKLAPRVDLISSY